MRLNHRKAPETEGSNDCESPIHFAEILSNSSECSCPGMVGHGWIDDETIVALSWAVLVADISHLSNDAAIDLLHVKNNPVLNDRFREELSNRMQELAHLELEEVRRLKIAMQTRNLHDETKWHSDFSGHIGGLADPRVT